MSRTHTDIQAFYAVVADSYETEIIPIYRQFAAAVLQTAQPEGHEAALDIGTGTGILARLMAPRVTRITGIDITLVMLHQAQKQQQAGHYLAADAHHLPFSRNTFDMVVSTFGLNGTRPRKVFPEVCRILRKKGTLAFHEWNVVHKLSNIVTDIMVQYMINDDNASAELLKMRDFLAEDRPWYDVLQTADDYRDELKDAGFSHIQIWEDSPVNCVLPVPDYMAFVLAWPGRRMELAAMDDSTRGDCLDAMRRKLYEEIESDRMLHFNPVLFRVKAIK